MEPDVAAAYLGTCFPTVAEARTAHCLGSYPLAGAEGGEPFSVACIGVTETGLNLLKTGGAEPVAIELATSYSDCNEAAIFSAAPTPAMAAQGFGWGFTVVLVGYCAAWGVAQVLKGIR